MKRLFLVLCVAVAALLAACDGQSGPMAPVFEHQFAMLEVLEVNKEAPEAAGKALEVYYTNNERALQALKTQLDGMSKDQPQAFVELQFAHQDDIKRFNKTLRDLKRKYPKLFVDPRVIEVIQRIEAL
ncbi:MAG: hypothetical protein ACI9MR_002223 [Myxococcota bacterium]|jgi:hypothetical protein